MVGVVAVMVVAVVVIVVAATATAAAGAAASAAAAAAQQLDNPNSSCLRCLPPDIKSSWGADCTLQMLAVVVVLCGNGMSLLLVGLSSLPRKTLVYIRQLPLKQFCVLPHTGRRRRSNFPPSHSVLTPGQQVPALTLLCQALSG